MVTRAPQAEQNTPVAQKYSLTVWPLSGGGCCSEEGAKTKSDKKIGERGGGGGGNPTTLTVSSLVSEFCQRS